MFNLLSSETDLQERTNLSILTPSNNLTEERSSVFHFDTKEHKQSITVAPMRSIKLSSFADDFYSNLLDWAGDKIFYAIEKKVFVYNCYTEETTKIYENSGYLITAVKYDVITQRLQLGAADGSLFKIDVEYYLESKTSNRSNISNNFNFNEDSNNSNNSFNFTTAAQQFKKYKRIRLGEGALDFDNFNSSFRNNSNDFQISQTFQNNLHRSRIGCIANYEHLLITGSRERNCKITDTRSNNLVHTLNDHSQEICGISVNDSYLCTGGNDNKVFVYDMRSLRKPIAKFEDHKAAVKAITLNNNILYTGGGSADKSLKIYDLSKITTKTNKSTKPCLKKSIFFNSQVTNIALLNRNKMLCTFGYSDDDIKQIDLSNNKVKMVKRYEGHKNRVIHFAMHDTKDMFATASGDATIKIWRVNEEDKNNLRIR